MNILLLDIGFLNTGWSVIRVGKEGADLELLAFDCISTKAEKERDSVGSDNFRRIRELFSELLSIVDSHLIMEIAVELPHGGAKSARAIKGMAYASAVCACLVESTGLKCHIVTPQEVKNIVKEYPQRKLVGNRVEKAEVMNMISEIYGNIEFPIVSKFEHIADSITVGHVLRDKGII